MIAFATRRSDASLDPNIVPSLRSITGLPSLRVWNLDAEVLGDAPHDDAEHRQFVLHPADLSLEAGEHVREFVRPVRTVAQFALDLRSRHVVAAEDLARGGAGGRLRV